MVVADFSSFFLQAQTVVALALSPFYFFFIFFFISCYISFSIYSPQKVLLMDFFRFCILMPESEEYLSNSCSIDPDNGHCQIFLRRLPITSFSLLYMCPHAFLQRHAPFLYRASSSNSAGRVQANAVAVPQAIQDVCIAVFVKMFVSTFQRFR